MESRDPRSVLISIVCKVSSSPRQRISLFQVFISIRANGIEKINIGLGTSPIDPVFIISTQQR
jgi:hypothetical protein